MAEVTYAGYHCYLIIERQAANQCPLETDILYEAGGEVARKNGIMYVASAADYVGAPYDFAAPYTSFTTLLDAVTGYPDLAAWVFNINTGEGRFYDGDQNGDEDVFWSPMQRAIGRVHNFRPTITRPVSEMPEIGSMYPAALKSNRYSGNFTLDKTWIDIWKLGRTNIATGEGPALTKPSYQQFGFRGEELVCVNEWSLTLKQYYYMVLLYGLDLTSDSANVARSWLYPCSKFDEVTLGVETESPVSARLTGSGTYCRPIPFIPEMIQTYTHVLTPPP